MPDTNVVAESLRLTTAECAPRLRVVYVGISGRHRTPCTVLELRGVLVAVCWADGGIETVHPSNLTRP
ncbi:MULTISPECIES: hypothetical protein [unclassified Rhodococcus (in: high G+C Gram-positive bacteria)]|uniref:hypothetical protein n=1 Tax=unclassified Rhodococcus (in: high G+C Gram-positive bacteria) TaxID=192944 RepID=UPI003391F637